MQIRRVILGFTALILSATLAFAVGVKPLRTELTIDPGASASATIQVLNTENRTLKVKPELEIYTSNDVSGFPLPANDLAENDPRNIKSWIQFEQAELTLAPNSSADVTFTVSVPEGAEPGGRYASLVYVPVETPADGSVEVRTRVASLILVQVTGEIKTLGAVKNFGFKNNELRGDEPFTFAVEFENQGNIHVKPGGGITLANESGEALRAIASYADPKTGQTVTADAIPLNLDRGNVLPGSPRIFDGVWNQNVKPGKYVATLTLYYADGVAPLTQTFSFEFKDSLQIQSFEFQKGAGEATQFALALKNSGTVAERPSGKIDVSNEFDQVIKTIEFPSAKLDLPYVAPNATQTLTLPFLDKAAPSGRYTARLTATYGFGASPLTATTTFAISGNQMLFVYGGAGALALVILGVTFFVLRRKKSNVPHEITPNV